MRVTRRTFVQTSAAGLALLSDNSVSAQARGSGTGNPVPASIAALKPLPNPAPLEECVYMTANGRKFFTQPIPSIDQPFA